MIRPPFLADILMFREVLAYPPTQNEVLKLEGN
jgi:hypothetical protein